MSPVATLVLKRARGLSEQVATALWDEGTTGIWEVSAGEWRAFFPSPIEDLPHQLAALLPGLGSRWEEAEAMDWAARYQESLKPMAVGETFAVLPAQDQENPWPHRVPLRLAPGMAFGTGEHFTTASCVRILEKIRPFPSSLLDAGCGSGILAIAARLMGISRVAGCDIDAAALRIAEQNASDNGVDVQWVGGSPDLFQGTYDCVLANIEAEALMDLMPALRRRVRRDGALVLAGILWEALPRLLDVTEANGFSLNEIRSDGRWATLRMEG